MSCSKDKRMLLNQERSRLFNVVLHFPFDRVNEFVPLNYSILDSFCSRWACILHNQDVKESDEFLPPIFDNELVPLKPQHYHFVIETESRTYSKTIHNKFCDLFNVGDIFVDSYKVLNLNASLRYLIHKDNLEKYQYPFKNIITNDLPWLYSHFDLSDEYNTKLLISYLEDSEGDFTKFLSLVGLQYYLKNKYAINEYFMIYYQKKRFINSDS